MSDTRHSRRDRLRRTGLAAVLVLALAGGHALAQPSPSETYQRGLAAYQDDAYAEAAEIWRPAAEDGDPWAQYGLGLLHDPFASDTDAPDPEQARDWYAKAADQGVPAAQNNLALLKAQGADGVRPDPREGAALWRQAAENGHDAAAYNLGSAYASGFGVERDLEKARSWYRRAAELGNDAARAQLDQLEAAAPDGDPAGAPSPATAPDTAPDTATPTDAAAPPTPDPSPGGTADPPSGESAPAAGDGRTAAARDAQRAAAPATRPGIYSLQLGSLGSLDAARQEWARMQRLFPDLLARSPLLIEAEDDRFRLQARFVTELSTAKRMCRTIRAKNQQCIVIERGRGARDTGGR